jgi:hypothetical protein
MTSDDTNAQPGAESSATSVAANPRPSGRSRYSRGRRRPRRSTNRPRRPSGAAEDAVEAPPSQPPSEREHPREALSPPFQPAKVASIQAAIDKVTTILSELRDVLNDMELVLEYLEDAERQQIADEREIETLQQRLNTIHRRMDRSQSHSRTAHRPAEDTAESAG